MQRIDFSDFSPIVIRAYVDSDWAGCRKIRKSTSGGVLMLGTTAVRGWSTNQAVIALSSWEAEYYVALKRGWQCTRIAIHAEGYWAARFGHTLQ